MLLHRLSISLFFCFVLLTLSGCFPWLYRIEVQQGNIVDREKLSQLQPGMSAEQVRFLLGTPVLEQGLDPDRWEYYFSLRDTNGNIRSYRLSIDFDQQHFKSYSVGEEIFDLREEIKG